MLQKRDIQMNGSKWSVPWVWILLLVLGLPAGPAISMSVVRDSLSGLSTVQSRAKPEWHDYVAYMISRQLCDSSNAEAGACSSSIRNLAESSASHSLYALYAFEEFSGPESLLPMRAATDSGSSDLSGVAQFRRHSIYNQPFPPVDADRPEWGPHSLHDVPSLSAKRVIPGSLLVTILALIGIVAVARRDVPGKDHASATVVAEARPGVVSVTYLRHGAN